MRLDFAPMQSARKFLEGIIDYAGLFPPASLSMGDAVRAYATYRGAQDRDLLGRFVAPASRLGELSEALHAGVGAQAEPWRVSVTTGKEFVGGRDGAIEFNTRAKHARCDVLEAVASSARDVSAILSDAPSGFDLYIEVPADSDPVPFISEIAGSRAFAKIRTGGVTTAAIPLAEQVLRFMVACRDAGVPFKATAGLHHVIRSEYPLTYESDAPVGTMFGYLNIFLAAAAVTDGWTSSEVLEVLELRDASRIAFDDEGVRVSGRLLSSDALARARMTSARSFGSCSFTEPVTEARALGLI